MAKEKVTCPFCEHEVRQGDKVMFSVRVLTRHGIVRCRKRRIYSIMVL